MGGWIVTFLIEDRDGGTEYVARCLDFVGAVGEGSSALLQLTISSITGLATSPQDFGLALL